jgi:hypothetical protein
VSIRVQVDGQLFPEHDVWEVEPILSVDCPDTLCIPSAIQICTADQFLTDDGRHSSFNGGLLVPVILIDLLVIHVLALTSRDGHLIPEGG